MIELLQTLIPMLLSIVIPLCLISVPAAVGFYIGSLRSTDMLVRADRRKIALWALFPLAIAVVCIILWGVLGLL